MELEKQVVSLDLSRKLKELGVKQESVFVWSVPDPSQAKNADEKLVLGKYCEVLLCYRQQDWGGRGFEAIPAYTIQELLELLPLEIKGDWEDYQMVVFRMNAENGGEVFQVRYEGIDQDTFHFSDDSALEPATDQYLVIALAKMLTYLIEKNLTPLLTK